ncbi:MAG TPA: PAS domain-containing protein [Casimicrobiaceae bacterium]|nr:PAS domain-containing protein [Casimicrobiaceae bacterium]
MARSIPVLAMQVAPPFQSGSSLRPRRVEDGYSALYDFLPWGYLVVDDESRIHEINAAAVRLLGKPRTRVRGTLLEGYFPEGALLDALAGTRAAAPGVRQLELPLGTGARETRDVKLHLQWFEDAGRSRYRVALEDVTEVRRADLALRRAADEMRDLYQNAPCGYHSLDPRGTIIQINDTELQWLGYTRDEVVGRMKLTQLMPEPSAREFNAAFATLKQRGHVRDLQIELQRKDGSTFPALLSATALMDEQHRFIESRANTFDITRRKHAEQEASRYAQRLKGMASRAAEIQESERRALGRELHDRVGQNLTVLSINLNIVKVALQSIAGPDIRMRLDDSLALVDRTVEAIRNVMMELRPAVLDDYGLAAMLRWYAEDYSRRTGLDVRVSGADPKPRLPAPVETSLFRIVQESLTNVVKHAAARRVTLALEPGARRVRLTIADDGRGFTPAMLDPGGDHHGWGLMIMRERAEAVGGRLQVQSAPGQGTRVIVELKV